MKKPKAQSNPWATTGPQIRLPGNDSPTETRSQPEPSIEPTDFVRHYGYEKSTLEESRAVEIYLGRKQKSLEFSDIGYKLVGAGGGKLSTPYKSVLKHCPTAFGDEAQTTGDCTSHGTRNAIDIARAVEIDNGDTEGWIARTATEPIYGFRGHSGQGMSPALSTRWVTEFGSLLRKRYDFIDLTKYDSRVGTNWGRSGPPPSVRDEARKHPARHFARIRTVEEARDALAAGYGIHAGSSYGNDGTRDKNGIAKFNDSWNHDMAWGAADETGKDLFFLILNSWGNWNKGGHPEWGPIPNGSFLIPSDDAKWIIQNGEVWAVGDVNGFPPRQLPNYGTASFL